MHFSHRRAHWQYLSARVVDQFHGFRGLLPAKHHAIRGADPKRPFFIVGSGRSGTTLLRRMLMAGGEVYIPPETYALRAAIRSFVRNRHLMWPDLVYLTLSHFEFHPGFDAFDVSLRPLAQQLKSAPKSQRNLASLLDAFYLFVAESKGTDARRWGDKTPINTFGLFWIDQVFPDAQYIHMLRDGADVVVSYKEAGIYPSLDAAAHRWVASVQAVATFAQRYPHKVIELRYENLVQEPEPSLGRVCRFLEIDFSPSQVRDVEPAHQMGDVERFDHHAAVRAPITTAGIGKGREALSKPEREMLDAIMGRQLKELGYTSLTR